MALGENNRKKTFLNIKEGRLHYKDQNGNKKDSGMVEGVITAAVINQKEYEGKKYEELQLTIVDGDDKYLLQMKVNSGYFRAFCNQMKSGDTTKKVMISPSYKEEDGKKNGSMFLEQSGKNLPWYSTAKDKKDVPAGNTVMVNGEPLIDRTETNNYWKKWLDTVKWGDEFEASAIQYEARPDTVNAKPKSEENNTTKPVETVFNLDDSEDLPF